MYRNALCALLVAVVMCGGDRPPRQRGVSPPGRLTQSIDWSQSAGLFIGIETFLGSDDAPPEVRFAADDATDLAWLFAKELPSMLAPERVRLLLSGRPDKPVSLEHLRILESEGSVVADGVDAATIYAQVRELAESVGPNGVLILAVATHGHVTGGAHVLLTPDATMRDPKGAVLNDLLQSIPIGRGNRVLLFIDTCRTPYAATPSRLFEDLRFPGEYAIFSASGPGGYAWPDEASRNGYFTRAVIDGLRSHAAAGADGFITPATLHSYVGTTVKHRSGGEQRPEARFSGLTGLPLIPRRDVSHVARVVHPAPNAAVDPADRVEIEVFVRDLYATVLVCATSTGQCWKQNREPVDAPAGAVTSIGVQYGDYDAFRVHVALTADAGFLQNVEQFPSFPANARAERIVHWLQPVTVKLKEAT